MDFDNHFTVNAPLESVWSVMLDAQEVAPCVPGAELTETVDDTHFRGTVKVKLGAVQMTYRGELEMQADAAERRIVLHAKGTETRGSGGATGTFTTVLSTGDGGATNVDIHSHVDVTGRVAQFGRSIMQDVANRLIRDFASCLEGKLRAAGTGAELAETQAAGTDSPGAGGAPDEAERPASAPPAPPDYQPQAAASSELRLRTLMVEVARSRTAAVLRGLASRIEPK